MTGYEEPLDLNQKENEAQMNRLRELLAREEKSEEDLREIGSLTEELRTKGILAED